MLDDKYYMQRCIDLARRAEGRTSPNPLVGALVVDDSGNIIAEGFHARAGQPHAEVNALNAAGEAARDKTLYVSLEPCCHHGKTPPCSDRVIASGVKRVVFGLIDPNPKVAGGGHKALEDAGIETVSGVLEAGCRYLNRGFLKWITRALPWVTLKIAATIDGRIADRNRQSRWISGPEARQHVHELRNLYDCVLVGSATAVQDDPALTVRDVAQSRDPVRAVFDTALAVAPESRLATNQDGKTWLFAGEAAIKAKSSAYPENVRLIGAPLINDHVDLRWALNFLGTQSVRTVLCEGGARLSGLLLANGLVDELEWIVAPKLLTDAQSVSAVSDEQPRDLANAINLIDCSYRQLGKDLLIHGMLSQP